LTSGANKRAALLIFVEAGAFANEEDFGVWISLAGNRFCTAFTESTFCAYRDLSSYFL
jgi:hypothetical protein